MRARRPFTLMAAVSLLTVVGLAGPETVRAQDNTPQEKAAPVRLQLRLILGGGLMWGTTDSTYPTTPEKPRGSPMLLFPQGGVGVMWTPLRYAGIGLLARALLSPMVLGRTRTMAEVLAFPQAHVPFPRSARSRIYLGLPVGVVWSSQSQDWGRAVQEDWKGHAGLSVGAALGTELWAAKTPWGGLIEIAYQARFYSADLTSTLEDAREVQVKDRIEYRDHQILISMGLLLGFL